VPIRRLSETVDHVVPVPSSVIRMLRERRIYLQRNSRIRGGPLLAAALLMSLFFIATSQAQTDLVVFAGKFTFTDQVQSARQSFSLAIAPSSSGLAGCRLRCWSETEEVAPLPGS
jgi:hypothetical protein